MRFQVYALILFVSIAIMARGELILSKDHIPQVSIVGSDGATPAEKQACLELADYLKKITQGSFKIIPESAYSSGAAIFVGQTQYAKKTGIKFETFSDEEWLIRCNDNALILAGGRPRGTLYAVYHFLEDTLGVRWWNPFEEFVPEKSDIVLGPIDCQSKPAFAYREIHYTIGHPYDRWGGQFSARNRINAAGDDPIALKYGGAIRFGPPSLVHNLNRYLGDVDDAYKNHPDWFAQVKGKRIKESQLCLTNHELRDYFVEHLKKYIEQSRAQAAKEGLAEPIFFAIDQIDGEVPWCSCKECQAIIDREKSPSGLMLDFVNEIADRIRKDYPNVYIVTLAYLKSEIPPQTIRPRDNVIVRLTDTTSNMIRPMTDPSNKIFRQNLYRWSKVASKLMIWDYAVNFQEATIPQITMCAYGFPFPSYTTYQPDYQVMHRKKVFGLFIQHEFEIAADMRDMKIWLETKLLEDPSQDSRALIENFVKGYYGPAAPYIMTYLRNLEQAAVQSNSFIDWFARPGQFQYLNLDFLGKSDSLFDKAEACVQQNPIYLRRVRHARLAVDSAILIRYPRLFTEWNYQKKGDESFVFDRNVIAKRYLDTWKTQCDLRWAVEPVREEGKILVDRALKIQTYPLPERFSKIPAERIYDYSWEYITNHPCDNQVKLVADAEAETGFAHKTEVSRAKESPSLKPDWYTLPMFFGIYDPIQKTTQGYPTIKAQDIPGPGYHWYRLGSFSFSPSAYAFFYGSWEVQLPLGDIAGAGHSANKYEFWVNMKFEGPSYPYGKSGQSDAIYIQRVIVIRE